MQQRHGHKTPRYRLELGRRNGSARAAHGDEVRVCTADGCETRLSAYNESELCYRHRADARSPGWQ